MTIIQSPKLPLEPEEKAKMRSAGVRLKELYGIPVEGLVDLLDISPVRAQRLKSLAIFQNIPSIGIRFAENLVDILEIYGLEDLKDKDPADLFDRLEKGCGYRIDPCVEDQFRCAVNYANDQTSQKKWHDFTEKRKRFREEFGYPKTRPEG
ncbi:helix-hairpin-helix domain-containing protein [Bacillus sp. 1P06AnD]|uniref:helix-hairpin-helix domain-containing protein n=1 Tax=Bacillus sp. 1P06AnD TaxID=3132208 RepID=UPI0039A1F28F